MAGAAVHVEQGDQDSQADAVPAASHSAAELPQTAMSAAAFALEAARAASAEHALGCHVLQRTPACLLVMSLGLRLCSVVQLPWVQSRTCDDAFRQLAMPIAPFLQPSRPHRPVSAETGLWHSLWTCDSNLILSWLVSQWYQLSRQDCCNVILAVTVLACCVLP